ncbi:hypothetical protein CRYUN_Cryun31cG0002700 [Craigia yunnanensis]
MATCIDNPKGESVNGYLCCSGSNQRLACPSLCCRFAQLCGPSFSNLASCRAINWVSVKIPDIETVCPFDEDKDDLWVKIREEAQSDIKQEPILLNYYSSLVLSHSSLESALANLLAMKLSNSSLSRDAVFKVFLEVFAQDEELKRAVRDDINATRERDPACISYVLCFLHFKGFQACQAHRAAHKLWSQGRVNLALLIQSRVSEVFAVDIHPGAKIGRGIVLDHATGIVIGETAVIGDNVTILHNVTLGGTGKVSGDRHPKIDNGVLIGAGTKVLGNIRVGEGAKIGAASVVLKEVPPKSSAVGNPARLVTSTIQANRE